jgi:hypothetical protein
VYQNLIQMKYLKYCSFLILCAFNPVVYAQEIDSTETMTCLIKVTQLTVSERIDLKGFLIDSYTLFYDSAGIKWESSKIPLDYIDEDGRASVQIPHRILKLHPLLSCYVNVINKSKRQHVVAWITHHNYNGEDDLIEKVKVNYRPEVKKLVTFALTSNPEKAKYFIFSNRRWDKIKDLNWQQNLMILEGNTDRNNVTNDTIAIDQTTLKVVFISHNKYIIKTHYTKPVEIESLQNESADFLNETSYNLN